MLHTLRDLFTELARRSPGAARGLAGAVRNMQIGSTKGAASSAIGLGELTRRASNAGLLGPGADLLIKGANRLQAVPDDVGTHGTAEDLGLRPDPESLAEKAGFYGEQLGEFMGPGLAKAPAVVAAGGKLGTLASMGIEGANAAVAAAAQGSDPKTAALTAAGGVPIGRLVGSVSPRVAAWLRGLAAKGYGKAIGATSEELKDLAEQIVPEMLKRRVTAVTRPSLLGMAERKVGEAGKALEAEIAKVPPGTMTDTGQMAADIATLRDAHMVEGGPLQGQTHFAPNTTAQSAVNTINEAENAVYHANPT
ncbi:MAG TPA: hypothetical protein VN524_00925, partial [Hyphomicrobiaceae bacterium]|nr:hypothetical protein [Hyphomicrobiaceae bacterium]